MLEKMDDLTSCSLSYVASILGGKWKPFIVWYLSMAPGKRARYSELRKRIPYDISHKMFSQHLSELEQVGIIERIVVEVKPLRVDYLLTAKGVSFANVLYFIRDWGAAYGGFSACRNKGKPSIVFFALCRPPCGSCPRSLRLSVCLTFK